MQITIQEPGVPGTDVTLTLRLVPAQQSDLFPCPVCHARTPVWFTNPASDAAMNPSSTVLGTPEICSVCLNELLSLGIINVVNVDADSF